MRIRALSALPFSEHCSYNCLVAKPCCHSNILGELMIRFSFGLGRSAPVETLKRWTSRPFALTFCQHVQGPLLMQENQHVHPAALSMRTSRQGLRVRKAD